jgi:hypothetical protein
MTKVKGLFAVITLLALGAVTPVSAAPIAGTLTIQGTVVVSATTIDWIPDGPIDGTFTTKDPGTGYFSTIFSADVFNPNGGLIEDLTPVNPPPIDGFLSDFQGVTLPAEYDDLSFTLTEVVIPGVEECVADFDYAEGDTCRLGVFILTQQSGSVNAGLEVNGFFVDPTYGDDGSLNTANGQFSDTLNEAAFDTIREIIDIVDSGGSIRTGWTATFVATPVPEPATMLTFGLGTALVAAHRRRRNRKNGQA